MNHSNQIIVARLQGGLGNQLFIYAAARRIAEARNATLLLDTYSNFARDRKYGSISQIRHFRICAEIAPRRLCFGPPFGWQIRNLQVRLSKRRPLATKLIVREAEFDALCGGAPTRDILYLEGRWQSERYFEPIKARIADELQIASPLSPKSVETRDLISANNSIGLHIRQRRGAHHDPGTPAPEQEPQLPFSYYEDAVERIAGRVERPTFFCFGDNPDWIRERWKFPYPVHFVDHNRAQEQAYEDLALMAECKHFVVGNSTFSWWGAWLSRAREKIVIAPANEGRFVWGSEADLLPKGWTVLKVAGA